MTHANISKAQAAFGYQPHTDLAVGMQHFADWYLQHYGPAGQRRAADDRIYKPD